MLRALAKRLQALEGGVTVGDRIAEDDVALAEAPDQYRQC